MLAGPEAGKPAPGPGAGPDREKIEKKSNGTIVRIQTQKSFSDRNISSFINKHGWFYITIVGGVIDTSTLNKTIGRGVVIAYPNVVEVQ